MQHAVGQSIKEMDGSMQLLGAPWRPMWRRNSLPHFWRRNLWRVAAVAVANTKVVVANLMLSVAKLWPATKHPL